MNTTLVTAANSKTSRRVIERFTRAKLNVKAVSRKSEIPFDWTDSMTWEPAIKGSDSVYIVIPPELAFSDVPKILEEFVSLCEKHNLKHLVYLSGRGEKSALVCEQVIENSSIHSTILRASWFAQNFSEGFFCDGIKNGELVVPEVNAKEAFIDTLDIAEIVFDVITQKAKENTTYELTGAELKSFEEIAILFSNKLEKTVQYIPVPLNDYLQEMESFGAPEIEIQIVEFLFSELLDGRNESITNDVEMLLNRKPNSFSQYIDATITTGVWN